jgi:cytidine deaminase
MVFKPGMDPLDAALLDEAERVRARAYVPYSHFAVGAAILADDGEIYAGCNVENAAYPEGWCAETSAISAMIAGGGKKILRILVSGPGTAPVTPCGGCRQRIREFADAETAVTCLGVDGDPLITTLHDLLPHSFGPDLLGAAK